MREGMEDIYSYIENYLDESLDDVKALCSLPTVSASGSAIRETADHVSHLLQKCGFDVQILEKRQGAHPVVYGWCGGDTERTLLFYDHYDVQPPEPLDLWSSPPFEPEIRDGKLYGRGVCDNKGNIAARLAAIRAITAVRGSLPCGIKFCIEGDEEIGSPEMEPFIDEHKDLLAAEACIWEGAGVDRDGTPKVILGVKGLLYVELEAKGADMDLHSSYATVVTNPAWRLVWAISTIKNENERVTVDGFYDDVRPPTAEEMASVRTMPDEAEESRLAWGVKTFVNDVDGLEYRLRHMFEPTATVDGIVSGYTGKGPKTVLPSRALAKLDFRLVPDQDPLDILEKLRRHLDRGGFPDIEVRALGLEHPSRTPVNHPWAKAVTAAARDVYGKEPIVEPNMAGTGPLYPFATTLGLPTADCGVGYPDSRIHAPDENIRIDDFLQGTKVIAAIIDRFSTQSG